MRRTHFLILLVCVVVGGVFFFTRDTEDASEIEALARKQALREADDFAKAQHEKTDLDALERKGIGQAVPADLVSEMDRQSNFWFVGKRGSLAGVQIPFEPGKLPLPPSNAEPQSSNPGFLGAEGCRSCHEEQYESFIHTAHHRTTRLADLETVSGSFEPGKNQMRTGDPELFFTMVERDGKLFQRVSFFDWQFQVPFHLIVGSSKMAETYLYWNGDGLFQMNCTYLTEADSWINSPGFIDGDAIYARPVPAGCLECHTTYADLRKPTNHFTPSSLILGVSCERCHGPGKEHVDFHLANPDEKRGRHITAPSTLSRKVQMDICGQCHTGHKVPKQQAAYQFRPGDRLEDHYVQDENHDESANSVHTSNQLERMSRSECFKQSEMACVHCHNPHRNERGQTAMFSQRCLNCHQAQHCGMSETVGPRLSENCIDCHMPRRATENLRMETAEGNIFPPLRDHHVRIDTEATEEFLRSIEKSEEGGATK